MSNVRRRRKQRSWRRSKQSALGASCGDTLRRQQSAHLVSRIYHQIFGGGNPPVSAGAFELGRRGRHFDED